MLTPSSGLPRPEVGERLAAILLAEPASFVEVGVGEDAALLQARPRVVLRPLAQEA